MAARKWSIEVDVGAGFVARAFHDFSFDLRMNATTWFRCTFAAGFTPTADSGIKLWWDKGGTQERLWFRGVIKQRTNPETLKTYDCISYDPSTQLAQSMLGDAALVAGLVTGRAFRDYTALTPYAILTQTPGPPLGLTYNAQGNQVMALAGGATNAVTGANQGLALTFRAHTGSLLDYINNLCEQAVHNASAALVADAGSSASVLKDAALTQADGYWSGAIVTMTAGANTGLSRQVAAFTAATDLITFATAFPAAIAAGDTYNIAHYGFDWWCDYSGGGAAQLNVASHRQRAGTYTPEALRIGTDIHIAPRVTDDDAKVDRVLVIGQGSGKTRIESGWIGAGTREYVFTDKNITNAGAAINLANRIYNALNAADSNRYAAATHNHGLVSQLGDYVSITPQAGGSPTTYRLLGVTYSFLTATFTLDLGRQRRFLLTQIRDTQRNLDAIGQSPQKTDLKVPSAYDPGVPDEGFTFGAIGNVPIAAGATYTTPLGSFPATITGDYEGFLWRHVLFVDAASASNYDLGITLLARIAGTDIIIANLNYGFAAVVGGASAPPFGDRRALDAHHPFAIKNNAGSSTITEWRLAITNYDPVNQFVLNNNTSWVLFAKPKHQHNADLS